MRAITEEMGYLNFHAKIMQFKDETLEFSRKKSSILGSKIQIFQDFDFCLK